MYSKLARVSWSMWGQRGMNTFEGECRVGQFHVLQKRVISRWIKARDVRVIPPLLD